MAAVQEKAMCLLWFFETDSVIETQCRCRAQYGKDPNLDTSPMWWYTILLEHHIWLMIFQLG
jgi:hypothetical protein